MDALAALENLEKEQKKKKATNNKTTPSSALAEATRRNARQARSQPTSRAPSISGASTRSGATSPTPIQNHLSPPSSPRAPRSISIATGGGHERSASSDARRISFVNLPRTPVTRVQVKIPTKFDSLSSGFPFDGQRLVKFGVSAKEWNHFSTEVVVACDAHHYNVITWPLARSKVIKKVRNDLRYGNGPNPGEVSKTFKKWNRLFRRQGFQAWMELPSEESADELGRTTAGMSKEDQKLAAKEAKRFRIVISPNDQKGGSIYSKSSIGMSVDREGGNFFKRTGTQLISKLPKNPEVKEVETKEDAKVEEATSANTNGVNGDTEVKQNGVQETVDDATKVDGKEESKG